MEAVTYYDDGKPIKNHIEIGLDFLKPKTDCNDCQVDPCPDDPIYSGDEYVCFNCEVNQVQEKHPEARYTDSDDWIVQRSMAND